MDSCPLQGTYQLARNVLAACVQPDGTVDANSGHALVIYDDRNPAAHASDGSIPYLAARPLTSQARSGSVASWATGRRT